MSVFAVLGDVFRPKSFAGLFGAAPSVAIATLALTMRKEGPTYAGVEGCSMIIGAMALAVYSALVCHLMKWHRMSALVATSLGVVAWFAVAFGGKWLLLG